jgi:acid phosphatase family membrane protein YuiD
MPILAEIGTLAQFTGAVAREPLFWTLICTYAVTHVIKALVHHFHTGKWSLEPFWATGGMPSSHTAVTVALTAAIAYETGASPLFFACAVFSLVIIRDSMGVRASVGEQARVLNALSSRLRLRRKVAIVLGHTPFQVAVGFTVGIAVATAVYTLAFPL